MSMLDWAVLLLAVGFIVGYGSWRNFRQNGSREYLATAGTTPWYTIGVSVILTQASAITFLSVPGQAYEDGMGFIQFYFGLPLALVVVSAVMIPLYQRQGVITAYEYLEFRFDQKTRQLTAALFLVQRGLAAGLTIYAPAIILSSVMNVPVNSLNLALGVGVTLYTVIGGCRAVNYTQMLQMSVIVCGLAAAVVSIFHGLPSGVGLAESLTLAGATGKMDLVDFSFDLNSRYTFWSGITGGFFLALSYFGTDQSQVGRYLSSRSTYTSQVGLLCNALFKVPMQFCILLLGILVFVFYIFVEPPSFFNTAELKKVTDAELQLEVERLNARFSTLHEQRKLRAESYLAALNSQVDGELQSAKKEFQRADAELSEVRELLRTELKEEIPGFESKDQDHIFITFVTKTMPVGLVGLLLAAIFCAAMSSTSSELNALASTALTDFYKRSFRPNASEAELLLAARGFTLFWGAVAITFATTAPLFENLIQAVNIIGSLFYGTILGTFLLAFFTTKIRGRAVFTAAIFAELLVLSLFATTNIGFLWFNLIGCGATWILAWGIQRILGGAPSPRQVLNRNGE